MTSDDQQGGVDSGPRDAAKGFAYAILFIAWQVGAVYLSARWLMDALWAGLLVGVGPVLLVLWARRDAVRQQPREQGQPLGWLGPGARVGCAAALGFVFWFISWSAAAMTQKEFLSAQKAECMMNVKELTLAALRFADDHGGRLPDAASWADEIGPYVGEAAGTFRCTSAANGNFAYAYNSSLSGRRLSDIRGPGNVVLIFESDVGRNAAGGPELLPPEPRHIGGDDYGFVDAHAMWVMRKLRGTDERGNRVYEKVPVSGNPPSPLRWRP